MSQTLASWIYRWRIPLSVLIVLGAIAQAPRANITQIDNDITAWFSKADPVYQDYERFRAEFGGTRALIIAIKADSAERLFSRETLRLIDAISGDIEGVETVERVNSLATATIVEALRDGEMSAGQIIGQLGLEQANASQHFAVLRSKQVVTNRKEGNQVFYSLRDPILIEVLDVLKRYFYSQLSETVSMLKEIRLGKGMPMK